MAAFTGLIAPNPSGIISRVRQTSLAGAAAGTITLTGIDLEFDAIISVAYHKTMVRYSQAIDIPSVAANTTEEDLFTVTGVVGTTSVIIVNKPTLDAGLAVCGARASAADQIGITSVNSTGSAVDPSSETYLIIEILATPTISDLTSEFSISADDTITNASGTATTNGYIVVAWYDHDWGATTNASWI